MVESSLHPCRTPARPLAQTERQSISVTGAAQGATAFISRSCLELSAPAASGEVTDQALEMAANRAIAFTDQSFHAGPVDYFYTSPVILDEIRLHQIAERLGDRGAMNAHHGRQILVRQLDGVAGRSILRCQ